MTRRLEALLVLSLCLTLLQAEDHGGADEYEIKAAMLLNLTKFVQWPAAKLVTILAVWIYQMKAELTFFSMQQEVM